MISARRSRWPMHAWTIVALVVIEPARAQADTAPSRAVAELLRKLEQRDAVIVDLQRRVEQLEHQIGTTPDHGAPIDEPRAAKPQPTAPLSATSAERKPSPHAQVPAAGSSAALGQIEVDEKAAERALERTLVVTGGLLLPVGQADLQPSLTYIRSQAQAPTSFTSPSGQLVALQKVRGDTLDANLFLRLGLPFDSQLEVGLPFRYVEQQVITEVGFAARAEKKSHGSGFGDISLGVAKTLLRQRSWWPDIIGRVTWDTASGKTSRGGLSLGGGFNELQGTVSMTKRQDPLVFVGSASFGTTFEKDRLKPGNQFGISVGALLAASPETSLRLALNQTFVDELEVDGRAISGSDQVIGMMNIGASSILGRGKFLDLALGMGLTDEAPDYSIGVSFAIRFDPRFSLHPRRER